MRLLRASASSLALVAMLAGSAPAAAQSTQSLDAAMDSIAQKDSANWIYTNSYDRGSMRNSRIVAQSSDGSRILVRGNYTYQRGTSSTMTVRIVGDRVDCISYDTSFTNCTLTGSEPGAGTVVGLVVVGVAALALSGSGNSRSGSSNRGGYPNSSTQRGSAADEDFYRRQNQPPPPPPAPKPDTSTGCVWGDRSYGTCP
ncbi:MAG: hypothetical protein ACOY45_16975 [Pseudomonadota bacterium]